MTTWGWEWFRIEDLAPLAEDLWVNTEDFNTCMSEWSTKNQVEREFKQWVMLGINSVPTNIIINNETWEYIIVSETINYEQMEEIINDISK
jgi:predicted DsbA family dithiol-disulfide isomerase